MFLDPLSISIPTTFGPTTPSIVHPTRRLLYPSPDHPDDYILEIDYSSMSKFLECPRSYENYAIHSRQAVRESTATAFGRLFHVCEEIRLRHGLNPDTIAKQRALCDAYTLTSPVGPTEYRTAERMTQILKTYNERYATDGWPESVLYFEGAPFVERPFKVSLCTIPVDSTIPYPHERLVVDSASTSRGFYCRNIHVFLTGRIDLILADASGLIWVVDHKTTSRGGKEFFDYFRLSLQTRGYAWAAQRLTGLPVAGLRLNAAIIRPPTPTGKWLELDRPSYFYSQDSLDEYAINATAVISDIVANLTRGYFGQHGRSFKSPCSMCEYAENCGLPRHQRAADLTSDIYQDVTWNPINE